MSHGILEDDAGVVWGTTWHQMTQYLQLDRAPTVEEVRQVLDFPIEKRRLYFRVERENGSSRRRQAAAHCLYRPDTARVLVPAVGERYALIDRTALVNWIEENLLKEYPDLVLESAGTFWGGRIAFINMVLERFHIKGDGSENLNRLMYYDPLGERYGVCAHTVRVVCNNTLAMASDESLAKGAMFRVKHTEGAHEAITKHLVDLAETRLACKQRRIELEALAKVRVKPVFVKAFTSAMFPVPDRGDRKLTEAEEKALERQLVNVRARRNGVEAVFDQDPQHLEKVSHTAYGLLNAFTYWTDHVRPVKESATDDGTRFWDGLTGWSGEEKGKAHEWLVTTALLPTPAVTA